MSRYIDHALKISEAISQVHFTRDAIVEYLADAEPWSDATLRAMVAAYKQYRAEYRALLAEESR